MLKLDEQLLSEIELVVDQINLVHVMQQNNEQSCMIEHVFDDVMEMDGLQYEHVPVV